MVTKFGFTDDQRTMAGGSGTESTNAVDTRVAALMAEGQKQAQEILAKHRDKLDQVASILVDKNTIYRDKFLEIVGESPVPHPGEAKPIPMVAAPT
jgi:ATP-dependent Zn protease